MTDIDLDTVRQLATQLRVDSIRSSTSAGSGHPTSSLSAADVMAVLLARHLRYDWDRPELATNDHLIFSKGHASPLLDRSSGPRRGQPGRAPEGLPPIRQPSRRAPDAAPALGRCRHRFARTGPVCRTSAIALAGARLDELALPRVRSVGDSEMTLRGRLGSLDAGAHYGASNLYGRRRREWTWSKPRTMEPAGTSIDLRNGSRAFGWSALPVDGHDLEALLVPSSEGRQRGGRNHGDPGEDVQGQGRAR